MLHSPSPAITKLETEFGKIMRHLSKVLISVLVLLYANIANGADFRIGLIAPQNAPFDSLGKQMRDGANLAIQNKSGALIDINDGCSADSGTESAKRVIDDNAEIVVGFFCTESLESALPLLSKAGIPVITQAVRTDRITDDREKNNWQVWRTAPRADAEADAISEILLPLWRTEFMAIVDDGTIYGRDLAEKFRLNAEMTGLRPVFIDTFRPEADNQIGLVGRLRRAGATHVFVGGERDDIARIARDAASLDYELTIAGGEALRAAGEIALSPGVLMVAPPEWQETNPDDAKLSIFANANILPEGYVVPSYAALEIALETIELSRSSQRSMSEVLSSTSFNTILGPMSFNSNGDLFQNHFRLMRYDGNGFLIAE